MTAAYFRLVLRRYGRTPELAARILAGTGVDPEETMSSGPEDAIALGQQLQQLRNMVDLEAPGWSLEAGRAMDSASHGVLGLAAASAPNLGEAASVLERYGHVRAPYFRVAGEREGPVFRLRYTAQLPIEPPHWRPLVEMLLLSTQALVESALGRPMSEARFHVDFEAPEYADRYADFFHAPVVFGQPTSELSIPSEWLPLACPFADPTLHQRALERLEAAECRLQGRETIVAHVERILENAGHDAPGADQVAAQLRLSRRSLVRRLEQAGTSFRELAANRLRRRAGELLAEPQLTISEVAYRLGYAEPSSFGRAFRRWFGTSPSRYRSELGQRQPSPANAHGS